MHNRLRTLKLLSIWLMANLLAGLALGLFPMNTARAARICFVNAAAGGANNGNAWTDAYSDLQSTLGTSTCTEVWVAAGTYKPTTGTDRFVTFQLKSGVALYGGFGGTETQRSQRDWTAHVTILSGGIGLPLTPLDNSMHVVTGANNATLDGFTIMDGNASDPFKPGNYYGGGIYNENSSPTLTNLIIYQNDALNGGGGLYNKNGSPVLSHVIFQKNRVLGLVTTPIGGGLLNTGASSSPVLTDVLFIGNVGKSGGGVYNENGSLNMTRAAFVDNTGGFGGDFAFPSGTATITNITFYNSKWNTDLDGDGGGIVVSTTLVLTNATFWGSKLQINSTGTLTLRNSIFAGFAGFQSTCSVLGSVVDGGGNLFAYGCGAILSNTTINALNVGPLADNGGVGYSFALLPGSSAIGAANSNCPADDQRGQPRSSPCDSGAYEYNAQPFIATLPGSQIAGTSATLNGTVNANNASTIVTFEYGLTNTYGSSVSAAQSPVSGTDDMPVSQAVTGLIPNATYHYRVVAVSTGGTINGADQIFTTLAAPATAVTSTATAVTPTGATLNGTVNANHDSATVTFEYGLLNTYGSSISATQSPVSGSTDTLVSKAIAGLTPNTLYHYRVVATNLSGSAQGLDQSFTTPATPPTATTDAATAVTTTSAALNGTVNANNASATVLFEYGLSASYGGGITVTQSPVSGSANTLVSKTIAGLTPNATYHYRVIAINAGGTTNGADQTFNTSAAPAAAVTSSANAVTTTGATLNGTVNANNASATITLEYGLTISYGSSVTATQSPLTGSADTIVSKAITGLTPNTTYHYRVVAINTGGTSHGLDQTFATLALSPTTTTDPATTVDTTSATLNAIVNAHNASTTVLFEYGLTVDYGSGAIAMQSPVSGSADTSVSKAVSGLIPNATYHYRVIAINAGGTTNGADQTFNTPAAPPTAVTSSATAVTITGATLKGAVNPNNASTTVSFEYGQTDAYGSIVPATQSPLTGSINTPVAKAISGLALNTTYHFRVIATNPTGTTQGLDQVFTTGAMPPSATTAPATAVTMTSATLKGTVNANNDSTIVTFEYGLTDAYGSSVTAAQSPVSGSVDTPVNAALSGLTANTVYHYRIVAVNTGGTTYGADLTFTSPPNPASLYLPVVLR